MPTKNKVVAARNARTYYLRHRAICHERVAEIRRRSRDRFQDLKAHQKCKFCGESHPACLDFHHRDKAKKNFTIANAVANGVALSKVLSEIEKCDVVCSNCHRKLHFKEHHEEKAAEHKSQPSLF